MITTVATFIVGETNSTEEPLGGTGPGPCPAAKDKETNPKFNSINTADLTNFTVAFPISRIRVKHVIRCKKYNYGINKVNALPNIKMIIMK